MVAVRTAALWDFERAAEAGVGRAQYQLALVYANGHGVVQDYVMAHKWFNLAERHGIAEARRHRAELAHNMRAAEVAEAQRLAREWALAH